MSARRRADERWHSTPVEHRASRFIPGLAAARIVGHCATCHRPIRNDEHAAVDYVTGRLRCARVHDR